MTRTGQSLTRAERARSRPDLQVLLPALVGGIAAGYLASHRLVRHALEATIALMGLAIVVLASGTPSAAQEVIGAEHWVEQAKALPVLVSY